MSRSGGGSGRLRRDSSVEEAHWRRSRAAADFAQAAVVEAVAPVELEYSGPVEEPADDAVAIGGEPEWTWAEWCWFGEVSE